MSEEQRIHLNPAGEASRCSAVIACPFGSADDHFETFAQARAHFEQTQKANIFSAVKRSKFLKRAITAGSMTLIGVTLVGCSSIEKPIPYEVLEPQPAAEERFIEPEIEEPSVKVEAGLDKQAIKDKISDAYETSKDWVNSKTPALKEAAKEALDAYNSTTPGQTTVDPAAVYWQGRSLTPTGEEVAAAQASLQTLVETPETTLAYNRDEEFGRGFKTGLAGAIEHRDVPTATFRNTTAQARVVDGHFNDPYTGLPVHVIGGKKDDADIDHLVPTKEAWDSGASSWTKEQRVSFANDMDNLVYTASSVNRSKNDKDAADFIPSYEPAQCRYVVAQIQVKSKYKLTVDSREKAALQQVISSRC